MGSKRYRNVFECMERTVVCPVVLSKSENCGDEEVRMKQINRIEDCFIYDSLTIVMRTQ